MDKFLITGASSGIGRELAIRLAARGAKLTLHGRSEAKLSEVVATCAGAASIETLASDITAPHAAESLVTKANESMGGIDCVIHCAGIGLIKPAADTTDAEFSKIVNTNLRGTSSWLKPHAKSWPRKSTDSSSHCPAFSGKPS